MDKSICLLCKWRDWYIEIPIKTGSPSFVEVCPFHKERVMKIYKQEDCPDFDYEAKQ